MYLLATSPNMPVVYTATVTRDDNPPYNVVIYDRKKSVGVCPAIMYRVGIERGDNRIVLQTDDYGGATYSFGLQNYHTDLIGVNSVEPMVEGTAVYNHRVFLVPGLGDHAVSTIGLAPRKAKCGAQITNVIRYEFAPIDFTSKYTVMDAMTRMVGCMIPCFHSLMQSSAYIHPDTVCDISTDIQCYSVDSGCEMCAIHQGIMVNNDLMENAQQTVFQIYHHSMSILWYHRLHHMEDNGGICLCVQSPSHPVVGFLTYSTPEDPDIPGEDDPSGDVTP